MIPQFSDLSHLEIIDNLPGIIWFKDRNLSYVDCNERCRKFTGLNSKEDLIGHNDFNLPWSDYAESYREGDKQILAGKQLTFLHPARLNFGKEVLILTRKSPIYNQSRSIVGIMGNISLISTTMAMRTFTNLSKIDLPLRGKYKKNMQQYVLADNLEIYNLSKCESICLFYLIRGKMAKEISVILNRSVRTIEKHIEAIKNKLNCKTKSDVICKAIDQGFVEFIPSEFFINQIC